MASNVSATNHQIEKENYDPRILNWCTWKVFFPLVVILLLWPAYRLQNFDHPFPEAFKHGDLIIFSALILIEAVMEGERGRLRGLRHHVLELIARISAFLCLAAFVFLKIDLMVQEKMLQEKAGAFSIERPLGYSLLGWSIALLAAFISINTYIKAYRQERTDKLKELEEEVG